MSKFITPDGLSLDYLDEGDGPVVLCLPGITRDLYDFDDLAAAMGDEMRMIRLTMRGRKGSDFDPDFRNYTVEQENSDAIALLDYLEVEKVTLIGSSRAAHNAVILAATMPERLSGVLLNDLGPEVPDEDRAKVLNYLGRIPSAKNLGELVMGLKSTMGIGFTDVPNARWAVLAQRWFDVGSDGVSLTYDAKVRDAFDDEKNHPAVDLWAHFVNMADIPIALLHAQNSDMLKPAAVGKMRAQRPDMIFAEVPNRGHVPFLDEPESLAVIRTLLEAVR